MRRQPDVSLADVQAVYSGFEARLWERLMGDQIHVGGIQSSTDLAQRAGVAAGTSGIDLCCCTGAGMRWLIRSRGVEKMTGVDATPASVERGLQRSREEGLIDRTDFLLADACDTGLPDRSADFVWGEDAWCYVLDKPRLIAEAARLVRSGGAIAFTDWVEGDVPLTDAEADRFLRFMKFGTFETRDGYATLLRNAGCRVIAADNTGRFAPGIDLYLKMVELQIGYDVLKVVGFDQDVFGAIAGEMRFIRDLSEAGKVIQGLFVARVP